MSDQLPQRIRDDVLTCVGFFTRLPTAMPPHTSLGAALWAAPVAGLLVGCFGAAALGIASWLGSPASSCAVMALAATALITGCLHEDGLADVADGFGGGATRERKLEIMKDSRIGTFGVVALLVTFLARWTALSGLPIAAAALALVSAHIASRAVLPAFMALVPPARPTGLSVTAGFVSLDSATLAAALGLAGLLICGTFVALVSSIALLLWFFALKRLAEHQIGGQTGDVLGTLQQGGEVIVLLVAVALHPAPAIS